MIVVAPGKIPGPIQVTRVIGEPYRQPPEADLSAICFGPIPPPPPNSGQQGIGDFLQKKAWSYQFLPLLDKAAQHSHRGGRRIGARGNPVHHDAGIYYGHGSVGCSDRSRRSVSTRSAAEE